MTVGELIKKLQDFSPTAIVGVKSFGGRTETFLEADDLTQWWVVSTERAFGLEVSEAENVEAADCVVIS